MKRLLWIAAASALVASPALAACPPCFEPGIYTGVDLLFLSPKINSRGVEDIFFEGTIPQTAEFGGSLDAPLEFAQRLTVGYQGELGGGIRARWFTYDNELDYEGQWVNGGPPVVLVGQAELDVDAVDLELTQVGSFRTWTWMASAGGRYGRVDLQEVEINFQDIPAAIFFGQTGVNFEGAGPTFSIEAARPVLWNGLSLFANLRSSLLFGDSEVRTAFMANDLQIENDFVQVWEYQAGARQLCSVTDTVDFVSGFFWEAQRWDSDSNILGDFAFHGFGAQFGFLY